MRTNVGGAWDVNNGGGASLAARTNSRTTVRYARDYIGLRCVRSVAVAP